jgi:hypothetical protein
LRRTEIIDRERRWARPAAFAAFGVLIFLVASVVVQSGVDVSTDTDAEFLRTYEANASTLILSAILNAIAFALFAPVLAYLFKAAEARSDRMRSGLIGLVFAGPLFLAAALILQSFAYDSIAADFVASDGAACPDTQSAADQDQCVEDLIADDSLASVAGGLQLAGSLGLVIGVVYTSLNAMRVGLLTRFLGTLGMAVGVASLLFGPIFLVLYALALGLLYVGLVPGGRPPAWDAGEAVPWPAPGERQPSAGPREDEDVEGRAEEVFPDAAAEPEEEERPAEAPEPGSIADEVERASERPQKRKRRR